MPMYYGTGAESHSCGARDAANAEAPRRLCFLLDNMICDDIFLPVIL